MSRATINDVAVHAGVSIKTVSRVVNNEPNVRPKTRERVLKSIEALDYRPNQSARRLAGNRSYLIALLYDNPSASYVINVQSGVLERCRRVGYDLLIHPCHYRNPGLVGEIDTLIRQSRLDGLILTPPVSDNLQLIEALDAMNCRYVRVAPGDDRHPELTVMTNDREACADMVRYLVSLGHRDIGFIIGHPDHKAVATRYAGFLDGMKECGLPVREDLLVQGHNSFESGMECARQLLQETSPAPTAIFASNDDMAAGAMRVAHELGVAIPGALSVAGFDDIPLARQVWPALTTIRQPIRAMAAAATELLLKQVIESFEPEDLSRHLDSSLVVRNSTGPSPTTAGGPGQDEFLSRVD